MKNFYEFIARKGLIKLINSIITKIFSIYSPIQKCLKSLEADVLICPESIVIVVTAGPVDGIETTPLGVPITSRLVRVEPSRVTVPAPPKYLNDVMFELEPILIESAVPSLSVMMTVVKSPDMKTGAVGDLINTVVASTSRLPPLTPNEPVNPSRILISATAGIDVPLIVLLDPLKITVSEEPGTEPVDQFVPVFQSALVVPVQVTIVIYCPFFNHFGNR